MRNYNKKLIYTLGLWEACNVKPSSEYFKNIFSGKVFQNFQSTSSSMKVPIFHYKFTDFQNLRLIFIFFNRCWAHRANMKFTVVLLGTYDYESSSFKKKWDFIKYRKQVHFWHSKEVLKFIAWYIYIFRIYIFSESLPGFQFSRFNKIFQFY